MATDGIDEQGKKTSYKSAWWLVLIPVLWATWAVWNGNARQERLDRAVDRAMSDARRTAMQKFADGEILTSTEFLQVAIPIAQATQDQLPIEVDAVTTWDSVSIGKGVLRYGYTLDVGSGHQFDAATFEPMMHKKIASSACVDPFARNALANGLSVIFAYRLTSGERFSDVSISANDCSAWGEEAMPLSAHSSRE